MAQSVRVAIGEAIRRAYKGSPYPRQEDLAEVLGVDQSTVSKWCRGEISVAVETVERIETVCERLHGSIYWDAGLLDPQFIVTLNYDHLLEEAVQNSRSNVRKLTTTAKRSSAARAAAKLESARQAASNAAGKSLRPVGRKTTRPPVGEVLEEPGPP